MTLKGEKAPLDNNVCERALKMAILHRNSLFYKTEHGAFFIYLSEITDRYSRRSFEAEVVKEQALLEFGNSDAVTLPDALSSTAKQSNQNTVSPGKRLEGDEFDYPYDGGILTEKSFDENLRGMSESGGRRNTRSLNICSALYNDKENIYCTSIKYD